ncbi:MAG TPA: ATP-dependent DNA helicase [Acidimicrobiales bacterium]|nr:ATP-dependent DNA helicase [Acidimicrobiales bacterium]
MPDPQIEAALERATNALARREDRPSQREMAEAVSRAIRGHRHLVVQAGTGTGKSLAYLVPALALGTRAVISTATKALQDQLAKRDLPQLAHSLGVPVQFAVLKGRSNYVCMQRVSEIAGGDEQLAFHDGGPDAAGADRSALGPLGREIRRLVGWASRAETGDRADLEWEPSPVAWAQVSVGARDCPGAARCPSGDRCFAEAARDRAAQADVVVVNTHLYATSVAAGGEMLPMHDLVVFDEAHELEDIASASFGFEIGAGRLQALARATRPVLDDPSASLAVEEAGLLLIDTLEPHIGSALPRPLDETTQERLNLVRQRVTRLLSEVRKALRSEKAADESIEAGVRARYLRAQQSAGHLERDLVEVLELADSEVAWVEGPAHSPVLKVAPLDVGAEMTEKLWKKEGAPTAVMTSATIPPRLAERLGLPAGSYEELDVGSPFAYDEQALLYCPMHLPDPRDGAYEKAMHDELAFLIEAAGGRTLALFTSWRAMKAAADALRPRIRWPLMTQSDLPKPALVRKFTEDEHSCLFATMGFWQGVDVPGSALSVVTIDRLPFPRPDDPLLQARRASLGSDAFSLIDIPRAATLLAQGVGRLIRSRSDRGVVAVLDTRLGRASYRWALVKALPPMRRTRKRSDVEQFLASLAGELSGWPD